MKIVHGLVRSAMYVVLAILSLQVFFVAPADAYQSGERALRAHDAAADAVYDDDDDEDDDDDDDDKN